MTDIKTKYHKLKKERKHFFNGGYIFLVVMSLSNVHKNDGNKTWEEIDNFLDSNFYNNGLISEFYGHAIAPENVKKTYVVLMFSGGIERP